ncbi:MAG: Alpha/Beta hydrolase protein [Piptocephalis tieghemiana]|nr:MAG: Alpha/Beta hydrolase protein [Piptocephalis tieghemiana]
MAYKYLPNSPDSAPIRVFSHKAFPGYSIDVKEPGLCDPSVQQYSGYLNVEGEDKHFFFWFFASRRNPSQDPLLLWLNGGPGCSSLTGLFMELGPCRVNSDGNATIHNPDSWNNQANVLFLDQPADVGYSHGEGAKTSDKAAEDVFAFLQLFLHAFPDYAESPFHIFGESYAGHYVPAIAETLFSSSSSNTATTTTTTTAPPHRPHPSIFPIRLESLGIGNGLVDPLTQYAHYAKMACNNTYAPVLGESECSSMQEAYPTCASLIGPCYRYRSAFACVPAAMYCNSRIIGPYQRSGQNPYDVRRKCDPGNNLCYDALTSIEAYLNRPEVMKELGVQVSEYKSCNMDVNGRFMMAGDWMRPYHRILPNILERGIRVLVYAGDADFICNWYGNKAWAQELEWIGAKEFNQAKDMPWYAEASSLPHDASSSSSPLIKAKSSGKERWQAGEVRTAAGLTFLRVFKAGHMVPYDQPEASADMIERWLSYRDF